MINTLKTLCALSGVSSFEDEVRDYIRQRVTPYATDLRVDAMGNLIVLKKGARATGNKLMLCAHMDEVGLIIKSITEDGYLKFGCVGGIDRRVLLGKQVALGEQKVTGVIGLKAIHMTTAEERKKVPKLEEYYIDIGVKSREEAEKDPRIVYSHLEENGGISDNTNACIRLASGAYFGLLDHDDILHESALYEVMRAIEVIGSISCVLLGAYPMVLLLTRWFEKPLMSVGKVLNMNNIAAAGMVATLANNIPMFGMMKQMDTRGKVINCAFAVSAAFALGDHLGFAAANMNAMIFPMIVGKLIGGVTAIGVAMMLVPKEDASAAKTEAEAQS